MAYLQEVFPEGRYSLPEIAKALGKNKSGLRNALVRRGVKPVDRVQRGRTIVSLYEAADIWKLAGPTS